MIEQVSKLSAEKKRKYIFQNINPMKSHLTNNHFSDKTTKLSLKTQILWEIIYKSQNSRELFHVEHQKLELIFLENTNIL